MLRQRLEVLNSLKERIFVEQLHFATAPAAVEFHRHFQTTFAETKYLALPVICDH